VKGEENLIGEFLGRERFLEEIFSPPPQGRGDGREKIGED